MDTSDNLHEREGWGGLWAPWFVLGLALVLTVLVTLYVAASTRENDEMRFERRVAEATRDVEDRMATYIAMLRGVSGLFSVSQDLSPQQFRRYVDRLKLDEQYGGVQGVGFSARVPPGRTDDLADWARRQRDEPFEIWPRGDREQYHAVIYLQPEDPRNRRAIGYDMFAEPIRREAMQQARDHGSAAASGRVTLVAQGDPPDQAGFVIYVPVYRGGETPATIEQRREKLMGFAYSPFRADDLFRHTFGARTREDVSIRVYDTAATDANDLLFATATEPVAPGAAASPMPGAAPPPPEDFTPRFTRKVSIQVAGRPWTMVFESRPSFEAQSLAGLIVPFALLTGLVTSLMLFGVTLAQARAHDQAARAADRLRRSEAALRRTEERLQMAMAAADLFAFTWDLRSDRLRHVGEVGRILGIHPGTGEELANLIHRDDRLRFDHSVAQALAGHMPHEVEFRIVMTGGAVHWLRERAAVELDADGSACRMVGICADVTRQKQVERQLRSLNETLEQRVADRTREAEQRSAQLRALASELTQAEQRERRRLAQVLHDHLQQLLVAAMMRMGPARKKADDQLEPMLAQVEDLIRQSITASRSLTVELSPPVLYDAGLCKGLEWLARSMKDKHGLTVDLACDPQAEPRGEDLRAFLFQAVRELLFNIVKHSQTDRAVVTLARDGDGCIRAIVEDHGRGFDPAVLRARGAAAEHFGLFSIQQRLELLGGELHVESPLPDAADGGGARITLLAPLSRGDGDGAHVSDILSNLPESEEYVAAEKLLDAYVHPATPLKTVRVVLADDHDVLREGLGALLHTHDGIEVVGEASDGEQVVALAHRLRPDVVVMDVGMPGLDGVRATRRILTDLPGVRVIGLSMHDTPEVAQAMRDAGASAYVSKDESADALLSLIRDGH